MELFLIKVLPYFEIVMGISTATFIWFALTVLIAGEFGPFIDPLANAFVQHRSKKITGYNFAIGQELFVKTKFTISGTLALILVLVCAGFYVFKFYS